VSPVIAPHDLGQLFLTWLSQGRPPHLGGPIVERMARKYPGMVLGYQQYRWWLEEVGGRPAIAFEVYRGTDR
jgi:hypothetical protein